MHWYNMNGNHRPARRIPVRRGSGRARTVFPAQELHPESTVLESRVEAESDGRSQEAAGRPGNNGNRREAPWPEGTAPTTDSTANGTASGPDGPARDEIKRISPAEANWQEIALRSRAEMENFRQRQVRRADEAIAAERERLLRQFLPVADNLRRALNHADQDDTSLREGVELVYRQLMRSLETEGVSHLEAVGQPFDPELHEAVAVTPANVASGQVVEEIEAGYKLNEKLLRPARVVVAE